MVERASTMAFAAGALVFPGGAVDPADLTPEKRNPRAGNAIFVFALPDRD